jgi:two-component system, NarL family, response regulator DegU
MSRKCGVVLVDDHIAFREGLRQIIEAEPDFEILGEAGNGKQALELIRGFQPTVAILDVSMPPPDGLSVARSLREENFPVRIILLTMYREESIFASARELDLSYVLKDSAIDDIVVAIETARRGERYTSPLLTSYLQENARKRIAPVLGDEYDRAFLDLLPVERQVLDLLAEYKTTRDIADELNIQPGAVENLRVDICQKLGLPGSHSLMKFALNLKASSTQNLP